jgi:hypothetical protein
MFDKLNAIGVRFQLIHVGQAGAVLEAAKTPCFKGVVSRDGAYKRFYDT